MIFYFYTTITQNTSVYQNIWVAGYSHWYIIVNAAYRKTEVTAEESFVMNAASHTRGELLDGTECEILIDIGASKSYMSKSYYMHCRSLHAMPKFTSTTKRIQVCNRQYVEVLFVIPVIVTIQKHRFEVFTLVSEIYENVDLVLGIKNLF